MFHVQSSRIELNRDHPPVIYVCRRAKGKFTPDGNINKPFWEDIPFTDDFVDISGKDFPKPRFRTRVKMCRDDENLYIAALLEGNEIWANITKRDSVMYYDNDFEVFIDPSSSTHNYMELEMNALNTQWDLMLTHPYRDGGRSVSCWDIKGVETFVHINGKLNDPSADNKSWSVEIKLPFAPLMETYSKEENPPELERCYPARTAPKAGEFWRMNFSRVQWNVDTADGKYVKRTENGKPLPEDNWVWAPTGLIDIHCPDFWGFVFFADGDEDYRIPENELRKLDLRAEYYNQFSVYEKTGHFTENTIKKETKTGSLCTIKTQITDKTFLISCETEDGKGRIYLRSDGYTYIE